MGASGFVRHHPGPLTVEVQRPGGEQAQRLLDHKALPGLLLPAPRLHGDIIVNFIIVVVIIFTTIIITVIIPAESQLSSSSAAAAAAESSSSSSSS
jgi:hypothetical protein